MKLDSNLFVDRIVINYIYNLYCEYDNSDILNVIINRTLIEEKLKNKVIINVPVSPYEVKEIKTCFPMIPAWCFYQKWFNIHQSALKKNAP